MKRERVTFEGMVSWLKNNVLPRIEAARNEENAVGEKPLVS
jgi:hypothetical protein